MRHVPRPLCGMSPGLYAACPQAFMWHVPRPLCGMCCVKAWGQGQVETDMPKGPVPKMKHALDYWSLAVNALMLIGLQ